MFTALSQNLDIAMLSVAVPLNLIKFIFLNREINSGFIPRQLEAIDSRSKSSGFLNSPTQTRN